MDGKDDVSMDAGEGTFALLLVRRAGEALQALPEYVHPAWAASLGPEVEVGISLSPELMRELLLSRFDLRWPDLSAAAYRLEHLWLLPTSTVKRVCVARALYPWRYALSRCVLAETRRAARALLGEAAFATMVERPARLARAEALPSVLDAESLCMAGWRQIKSELPWRDVRMRRLVDLAFPPQTSVDVPAMSRADETERFMTDLPGMFPECTWLFGSDTAAAT